jgi:hypothetical protein
MFSRHYMKTDDYQWSGNIYFLCLGTILFSEWTHRLKFRFNIFYSDAEKKRKNKSAYPIFALKVSKPLATIHLKEMSDLKHLTKGTINKIPT